MNKQEQQKKELFEAISSLRNTKEATRFFSDLLTKTEVKEFAKRWKAAKMLANNNTYLQVQKETKLSSTTIARISKALKAGKNGYKTIINRIHHNGD